MPAEDEHIPIPKFLGRDSKRGFFAALVFLPVPKGLAAGFLPVLVVLGGWSLRRVQSAIRTTAWEPSPRRGTRSSNACTCTRRNEASTGPAIYFVASSLIELGEKEEYALTRISSGLESVQK